MHYDISFPNLGIYLDHVGKSISIFGFEIAYYGIIIGSSMLIGFLWAFHDAKKSGQNPDDYLDLGLAGIICGIIGARIYYVIFSWDMYKDNLLNVFNLREGGLAIYGGRVGRAGRHEDEENEGRRGIRHDGRVDFKRADVGTLGQLF